MVNNTNQVYIYRALKDAVEKLNARKNTTFNSKRDCDKNRFGNTF